MRPQVAHWLSIGYTLPPTAKEAIKVAARIKALAKADQMPIYEVPASWFEQGPPAGAPPLPVQPPREHPPACHWYQRFRPIASIVTRPPCSKVSMTLFAVLAMMPRPLHL